eukprot:6160958-Prymnesium_polylepis.1
MKCPRRVVLPNSVAGRKKQCHRGVNYSHLSFRGPIEEGPPQTLRQSTPGAAETFRTETIEGPPRHRCRNSHYMSPSLGLRPRS